MGLASRVHRAAKFLSSSDIHHQRPDSPFGMNSFLTRLVIIFLILAAVVGVVHLGGHSATSFMMKLHGRH